MAIDFCCPKEALVRDQTHYCPVQFPNLYIFIEGFKIMRIHSVMLVASVALAIAGCDRTAPAAQDTDSKSAATAADNDPNKGVVAPTISPVALTTQQVAVKPVLSANCNLEIVDGTVVPDGNPISAKTKKFEVKGWLFDETTKTAPANVAVRLYSTGGNGAIFEASVPMNYKRPDLVKANADNAALEKAGFWAFIDANQVPAGKYSLRLSYDRAGAIVLCDNGRSILLP